MRRLLRRDAHAPRLTERAAPAEQPSSGQGSRLAFARRLPWRPVHLWHLLWIVPLLLTLGITAARAFGGEDDAPLPIIEQFDIQPAVTDPGGKVTLKWKVTRAESVSITPAPGGVASEGEVTITAGEAGETYILTAISGEHRRTSTVSIQITPQPPTIGYFEAEPGEIAPGESVVLNWSVVGQGAAVTIEPGRSEERREGPFRRC